MRITLIILAIVAASAALVLLIGAALPQKHRVSREIVLQKRMPDVYAAVRDFASAPSWRLDVRRVEMLEASDGRDRFREDGKDESITYELVEDAPNERLVTRIVDRDLGYFGSWTYELAPAVNGGTRIRITEDGEVPNVFFRFMSRFVFGQTSTMDRYLVALGRKFGENVTPK